MGWGISIVGNLDYYSSFALRVLLHLIVLLLGLKELSAITKAIRISIWFPLPTPWSFNGEFTKTGLVLVFPDYSIWRAALSITVLLPTNSKYKSYLPGGGGGGGRLGSILDGMCEHNFEGNGSFFSFKRMAWMNKFPFKMGVILAWSFNMGNFCLYYQFRMSHIFYSRTTI